MPDATPNKKSCFRAFCAEYKKLGLNMTELGKKYDSAQRSSAPPRAPTCYIDNGTLYMCSDGAQIRDLTLWV